MSFGGDYGKDNGFFESAVNNAVAAMVGRGGRRGGGEREREKESIGLRVCARAWGMFTCERRKFDIANMREG